jgi:sugar/nucleoside kinase (ribokinase family)
MTNKSAGKGVVVIGELNIDAVAAGLSEAPKMGVEILASDFQLTLGSASAIFACGIAKLGHAVTFISRVGADDVGKFCLAALRAEGVSTRHVSRDEGLKTGVTVSLSTREDRALVTYLGATAALSYDHINLAWLKAHNHLHMTSYFLQTRLRPSFPQILREARELGLSTSFDPNSDPSHAWSDGIRDVLAYTDVLFLNENEALQLTRARNVGESLKTLSKEVPCAVIKLGARGAVTVKDREIISARGFKVEPADTTGAGDSFAAGFVSSWLRGRSIAECLRAANACGALSTSRMGGTAGQPTRQALARFLSTHRTTEYSS